MEILEKILEYIFIPTCGICNKLEGGYLCKECEKLLRLYEISSIKNIKNDNIQMMNIWKYEDLIRKLILQFKFNNKSYLYKTFCEFIVKNKKIFDFIKSYDIIIPVPMHRKKLKLRGYNQSELIAREIAKKAKIDIDTNILIKIKNNKVQSTLDKKEREENTKNVYKLINQEKIYNKNVLIFDDIFTTGATINSCINEIRKAKVKKIGILTLAKD